MKSVLISIQPKWCELIVNGKKTIEVRKTMPKIETPFKCYIYCTKKFYKKGDGYFQGKYCGKVIGEFVCRNIYDIACSSDDYNYFSQNGTCLSVQEFIRYCNGQDLYGWEIQDLVIYDKPKDIDEFEKPCSHDCKNCKYWYSGSLIDYEPPYCEWEDCVITRPPQSWCYVEEVTENDRA